MTDERDDLDARLSSAFDEVRGWTPSPEGRFPEVASRARRGAAAQRGAAAAAALVLVVSVVAVATTREPTRVETADTPEATTTSTPQTTHPAPNSSPPVANAEARGVEVFSPPSSYCWADVCADGFPMWVESHPVLRVNRGDPVIYRWISVQPTSVDPFAYRHEGGTRDFGEPQPLPCDRNASLCVVNFTLPAGRYMLALHARFEHGSATYTVRLVVT